MKSFWYRPISVHSHYKTTNRYDSVVVGSGLCGLYLAYKLSQQGQKVLIIEKQDRIGFGASSRNAGFATTGSMNFYHQLVKKRSLEQSNEIWNFTLSNLELMEELCLKWDIPIKKNGSTTISNNSGHEWDQVIKMTQAQQVSDNNYYCSQDFQLNPWQLINMLFSHFKGDVLLNSQTIPSHLEDLPIYYCTNHHLALETTPQRAQIQLIRFNKVDERNCSNLYFSDKRSYARFIDSSSLIIGGMRSLDLDQEQTNRLGINTSIQHALTSFAINEFKIAPVEIKRWSGIMSFSKDELPKVLKKGNKIFIGGFSGHGNGFILNLINCLIKETLPSFIVKD